MKESILNCSSQNHNWYYYNDEIRCCRKCGFIEVRSPRHFSHEEAKEIRSAAGISADSIENIETTDPNPPKRNRGTWIIWFIISVFVYVYLHDRFSGISYVVDRIFIAVLSALFVIPLYNRLKSNGQSIRYYKKTALANNNLDQMSIILIGVLFLIGCYLGHKYGPPSIFKFGALFLGGLVSGAVGFNLIAIFAPTRYIRFWLSYLYSSERLIVPEWAIVILPVTSIISVFFLIELARVDQITGFYNNFWISFLDGTLVISFIAQVSILANIFRATQSQS